VRALVPVVGALLLLAACGGSSEPAVEPAPSTEPEAAPAPATTEPEVTTTEAEPEPEAEPPPRSPPGTARWIAGYRDWPRLNAEPIPPRASDPHEGTKEVYASQPRRANGTFPYGTVVVKEAVRPGKDFVGLVAAMRKRRGANPEHSDWIFVEWVRDARGDRYRELARDAVCWSCHVGARELDYVFTE
jgi:hypothetical protein